MQTETVRLPRTAFVSYAPTQVSAYAVGAQVLVGLASVVLGILGLVGIASMMMVLLRSSSVGGLLLDFLQM